MQKLAVRQKEDDLGKLNKYYTKIMLPELAKTARAVFRSIPS